MPETIKINVDFTYNPNKLLTIPERTEVPKGSKVNWNLRFPIPIVDPIIDIYTLQQELFLFTLYFANTTPFDWKKESLRVIPLRANIPSFFSGSLDFPLAEGVAESTGEYKYGVKVSLAFNNESIYDEDPYLIVF